MEINRITLLIEAGDIVRVFINRAPMVPGKWQVQFERKSTREVIPLTARRQNIRHFASIDSAIKLLSTLSLQTAAIDWS